MPKQTQDVTFLNSKNQHSAHNIRVYVPVPVMRRFAFFTAMLSFATLLLVDTNVGFLRRRLHGQQHHHGVVVGDLYAAQKARENQTCLTPEMDGKWMERTDMTVALKERLPGFKHCQSFVEKYVWNAPDLKSWDPNMFCKSLRNRTMLFIGDSTMKQSARTLKYMVEPGGCEDQIILKVSDTLTMKPMGGLNRGEYWTHHVEVLRPDIAVITAGAHIADEANFTAMFMNVLRDIDELKLKYPGMKIVWKTQNPAGGHPLRINNFQRDHPFEVARRRTTKPLYNMFNHQRFWGRDNEALRRLQERRIPFLDMRMLYSRVDAHPWLEKGDMLHFCLPGPLNVMSVLLQRLIDTDFAVSPCIKMM